MLNFKATDEKTIKLFGENKKMLNQVNNLILESDQQLKQIEKNASRSDIPDWMLLILIIIAFRAQLQPDIKFLNRFIHVVGFVIVVAILAIIGAEEIIPQISLPW